MRSSTSSSEVRLLVALVTTFLVLVGTWELVLRQRTGTAIDFPLENKWPSDASAQKEQWLVFGNCLVMTGVSPKRLNEQLGDERDRMIINIGAHEQSPIAFFEYLKRTKHYPAVVITNVSSWINGTNYEQEADVVAAWDPLALITPNKGPEPPANGAYQKAAQSSGQLQRDTEDRLALWAGAHAQSVGHRYHLFDFAFFLGALATTADLDRSFIQLNMQPWYRVNRSETDGFGYLGLHIGYADGWSNGLERMADRSLQRLRLSRVLTPRYWELLEAHVREFQAHGTRILFVRMPEHPKIRQFNEETYGIPGHLADLEKRLGTPVLDLSKLGPADGVNLFDGVHPDAAASTVITREVGTWLRTQQLTRGGAGDRRPEGGG